MNIDYKYLPDTTSLDEALKILRTYINSQRKLDEEKTAVLEHAKYIGASLDVPSIRDKINEIERRKGASQIDSHCAFDECLAKFEEAFEEVETPNGSAVDRDVLLMLENNMYTRPRQLEHVQRQFLDNPTMLNIIERYAAKQNWPDFNVMHDASRYTRGINEVKRAAKGIFSDYNGYFSDFVCKYDTSDKVLDFYAEG